MNTTEEIDHWIKTLLEDDLIYKKTKRAINENKDFFVFSHGTKAVKEAINSIPGYKAEYRNGFSHFNDNDINDVSVCMGFWEEIIITWDENILSDKLI